MHVGIHTHIHTHSQSWVRWSRALAKHSSWQTIQHQKSCGVPEEWWGYYAPRCCQRWAIACHVIPSLRSCDPLPEVMWSLPWSPVSPSLRSCDPFPEVMWPLPWDHVILSLRSCDPFPEVMWSLPWGRVTPSLRSCAPFPEIMWSLHLMSSPPDILEGNAKGIMRVILAMAERYCPTTVKARSSSDPRPMTAQPQERSQPQPMTRARSPDRYPIRRSPEGHYMPQSSSPDKQQHPPRAGSPDRLQPVTKARGGFSVSPLAANSFSVPNIAGLQRERSSSLQFYRQQLAPPPPQVYGNALSQPEKPYETIPEINPNGRERGQFSFSQQSQGDENDMYSNPIDQLPPWEPPQVIVGRQKSGGRNRRNSSGSRQIRGIHSIPEEEVVVEQAMEVMQREVGAVVNGMEEFKSELLQLHTLVCCVSYGRLVPIISWMDRWTRTHTLVYPSLPHPSHPHPSHPHPSLPYP